MIGTMLGAVVNIILDPIFIYTLGMGAAGAAIATVIGNICGDIFYVIFMIKKCRYLSVDFRKLKMTGAEVLAVLAIGIPASVTNFMQSIGVTLTNRFLQPYGTDKVAAMGIALKIIMISVLVMVGFAFGGQPLVGYNYGAKNADRVKKTFHLLLITCLSYSVLLWAAVQLVPRVFVSIFTADTDLIGFTAPMLKIYLGGLFLFGIQIACQMTFTSLGKAVNSIIVAVVRKFVLLIPLIYIMPHMISDSTTGVYMAEPIADITAVIFTSVLFTFQFKKALAEIQN